MPGGSSRGQAPRTPTYISAYPSASGTAGPATYVSAYPSSGSQPTNPSNDYPRFYSGAPGPSQPSFIPSAYYAPPQAAVYAAATGPAAGPAAAYGPGDAANGSPSMAPQFASPGAFPYGPPGCRAGQRRLPNAGGAPSSCDTPRWTIIAGADLLHRSHSSGPAIPLVTEFSGQGENEVVLSSREIDSGWGGGPHIDAIAQLDDEWEGELLYFGIDNFNKTASVSGVGLLLPAITDAFVFTDVTAGSQSNLNSGEANLLHPLTEQLNFLLGLRFLNMTDESSLSAVGQAGNADDSVKLNNMLSGFQIGGTLNLQPISGPARFEAFVKAGVFLNEITRHEIGSGARRLRLQRHL